MPTVSVVQALLASYGVKGNSGRKAISGFKPAAKADVSDEDLLQDMVSDSEEERRFLAKHVDILRMAGIDRIKQRGSAIWRMYRAIPFAVKMLMMSIFLFFLIIMTPAIIFMLLNVVHSKVAMAKLMLLLIFVLLIVGLQMWVGV